jgi:alpha-ribazole phosphatase
MVLDYPLLFDDRLKELNFGEWENRTWDEISEMEAGKKWFTDYLNETCPGGESYHDMLHRVKNFIADLPQSSGNILVITHAGIIRAFQVLLESQQANGTRNGQILPESKSLASVHSVNKVFDEPIAYGQITIIEKRP